MATTNDVDPRKFWHSFSSLQEQPIEWLIQDLLPSRSVICLFGKRGEGKTFLALDWACSIATNRPWANAFAVKRGSVAYVLAERPEGLKRRMLGWLEHSGADRETWTTLFEPEKGQSYFFAGQGRFALDVESDRRRLIQLLNDIPDLALVVLDPLVYFMDGPENETRAMQLFVEGLRQISDACRCSVLIIHHEGKGGGRRNNSGIYLGARGSSALEAGVDTVIYLGKKSENVFNLITTKQREALEHTPIYFDFKPAHGPDNRPQGKFPVLMSLADTGSFNRGRRKTDVPPPNNRRLSLLNAIETVNAKNEAATKEKIRAELELHPNAFRSEATFNNDLSELIKACEIKKITTKGRKGGYAAYIRLEKPENTTQS